MHKWREMYLFILFELGILKKEDLVNPYSTVVSELTGEFPNNICWRRNDVDHHIRIVLIQHLT